jgi:hypothetical protein
MLMLDMMVSHVLARHDGGQGYAARGSARIRAEFR